MGTIIAFLMMFFAFFVIGFVIYKAGVGISGNTSIRGIAVRRESKNSLSYNECSKLSGIKNKQITFSKYKDIKISLDIKCEKGEVSVIIKDNNGEIIINENKSKELKYKITDNNKLKVDIKFNDFYGSIKLDFI